MKTNTVFTTLLLYLGTLLNPVPGVCNSSEYIPGSPCHHQQGTSLGNILQVSPALIHITDKQLHFGVDITANKRVRFSFPEWITPVDIQYKRGKKTYRFAAKEMKEAGKRTGELIIRTKKSKQVIRIEQVQELNLQSRLAPVPQQAVFKEEGYFVWGASCIKGEDNQYHLFYSRWKKELGFASWASHSEIAHAVSKDLLGPYQFKNVVLPARGKQYWDGTTTHNPTIHKFGNKYYLYYMGNCGDGKVAPGGRLNWSHRNTQRIGVAVASDLNGKWTRSDHPLIDISPQKDAPDHLVVTNPSIAQLPNGKYVLVYKAVGQKKPLPFGGPVVHLAATSDSPTGPFVKHEQQIFTSDGAFFPAEDPFIWSAGRKLYAIVKNFQGTFTQIGCSLALFESEDGLHWKPARHKVVSGLYILWENGQKEKVRRLERPQLYIEDGVIKALFAAVTPTQGNTTYNVHIPILPLDKCK